MIDEIDKLRKRADLLERLRAEFPDLQERRLRWRTVLVSKLVNAKPEGVHTSHACGCCSDSPLQAWFHVQREGEYVYTDPPTLHVGEKNPYWGDLENEPRDRWIRNWEDAVRNHVGDVGVELLRPEAEQIDEDD